MCINTPQSAELVRSSALKRSTYPSAYLIHAPSPFCGLTLTCVDGCTSDDTSGHRVGRSRASTRTRTHVSVPQAQMAARHQKKCLQRRPKPQI